MEILLKIELSRYMNANEDLMALAQPREMVKSLADARSERFKHSLGALELRRQTNIETIATHTHDLARLQY